MLLLNNGKLRIKQHMVENSGSGEKRNEEKGKEWKGREGRGGEEREGEVYIPVLKVVCLLVLVCSGH